MLFSMLLEKSFVTWARLQLCTPPIDAGGTDILLQGRIAAGIALSLALVMAKPVEARESISSSFREIKKMLSCANCNDNNNNNNNYNYNYNCNYNYNYNLLLLPLPLLQADSPTVKTHVAVETVVNDHWLGHRKREARAL